MLETSQLAGVRGTGGGPYRVTPGTVVHLAVRSYAILFSVAAPPIFVALVKSNKPNVSVRGTSRWKLRRSSIGGDKPSIRTAVSRRATTVVGAAPPVNVSLALLVFRPCLDVCVLSGKGPRQDGRLAARLQLGQELPRPQEPGDGEVAMCSRQPAGGREDCRRPLHCVLQHIYYGIGEEGGLAYICINATKEGGYVGFVA